MKQIGATMSLLVCLFASRMAAAAQEPLVINLWPGKVPGDDAGKIGPEKFFEMKVAGKPHQVAGKPTRWLTNITKPTLTVYRPAKDRDTGVALLTCPGGGYHNLG